jgi:hypothetical protein
MAFDGGLFSFKDYKFKPQANSSSDMFILITSPKNLQFKTGASREPLRNMKASSHIRFLAFAKNGVADAKVFIDNILVGPAKRVSGQSPLYVVKWNSFYYSKGAHVLKVVVKVSEKIINEFKNSVQN